MATLPQLIEEDVEELTTALEDLLLKSEAHLALLIDKGGFLIAQCGERRQFDTTTLAALSAGSFAATETIAGLVSESNFSTVYQQGEAYSVLVMSVDESCLLVVVFRAQVSVGAVRYFAMFSTKRIAKQLKKAHIRAPGTGLDLSLLNMADATPVFRKKSA
jgi:predicted regulator of Ras-like GTPase activity (Roadblock/LC7/MglB family)